MPKIVRDEEIFQAIIGVIIERGYAGATTKQMAEAANVSEVTLFRKYENKAQLVKLAISAIADQMDFESVTQYSGDLKADLLRVVERYQNLAAQYGHFFSVLMPEMRRYPELVKSLDRPTKVMHDIGLLLARYQSEGHLRSEHSLHAAAALLGPLIYTAMLKGSLFDSDLPAIDLPQHVENFLHGRQRIE